jgi:elongation factor Ts
MKISASLVKQLRDKTGAGMMDCKKALTETAGDIDQAIDWLREKGISKAAKKADRIAAEGLCNVVVKGNNLNSESYFVAKNNEFLALLDTLANSILDSSATNTEEALKIDVDGTDVERLLIDATAKIGEKFSLRNVSLHTVADNEVFGAYKHMGGRIVTLVVLEDGNTELAKDIEICLLNQPFVKNPDLTVEKFMKENNSKIKSFLRLEVGVGIEKRVEDFAAEVASVVNN